MSIARVEYWKRGPERWTVALRFDSDKKDEYEKTDTGQLGYLSNGQQFIINAKPEFPIAVVNINPPRTGFTREIRATFDAKESADFILSEAKALEPTGLTLSVF